MKCFDSTKINEVRFGYINLDLKALEGYSWGGGVKEKAAVYFPGSSRAKNKGLGHRKSSFLGGLTEGSGAQI